MSGRNGNKTGTAAQKSRQKAERAEFVGYVNISLSDADKSEYGAWMEVEGAFDHVFTQALERGYQFSTKFVKDTDSYTCSVSCWTPGEDDAGLIYTAHSGSPYGAIQKAVWVLSLKLKWSLANGYVKKQGEEVW